MYCDNVSDNHQETYGERPPDLMAPFPKPAADLGLSTRVDSFGTFGRQRATGDLWFRAMVGAVSHDHGATVLLLDSVLNVVYRFEWTAPSNAAS